MPPSPEPGDALAGLPHRAPFVFIDAVREIDPAGRSECEVTFPEDHPMFSGHFPGNPLVPGVILTEALAQAAGIAAAAGCAGTLKPLFLLSGIRALKFLRPVRPGELVRLSAEKTGEMEGLRQFRVIATVGDGAVAEGQIILSEARADQRPPL